MCKASRDCNCVGYCAGGGLHKGTRMEAKICFGKYEAQVLLDALNCYIENGEFSDDITANVLYDRIVDAFKVYGIDLESDDDDE